jgi:hypothetical protein
MILPQFSLRMTLGFVAVLGVASLILSRALNGSSWAMGVSVALASILFLFFAYAVAFAVLYLLALAFHRRSIPHGLAAQRVPPLSPSAVSALMENENAGTSPPRRSG